MNFNSLNFLLKATRLFVFVLSVHFLFASCGQTTDHQVDNLKTDRLSNPIGLESAPSLSWQILSSTENHKQSAFQILVASSPGKLEEDQADLWNSGKVISGNSVKTPYGGKELTSGQRAYWKLRIWNQDDHATAYSQPAFWEMGLLNPSDWKGEWISAVEESDSLPPALPSPYFRKEFSIPGEIISARLYISGIGYYEAYINGEKVGDHVLDPVLTRYDKSVKYVTYDVSEEIRNGQNAIGVVLGNGWYNQHTKTVWDFETAPWRASPSLICQLEIIDKNGQSHLIKSDESWSVSSNGPIIFNSIYNGETYDARQELGPWNEAGYQESDWKSAIAVSGPGGKLSSQVMPPIRVTGQIEAENKWTLNDSTFMIDLGQNITGWANIKVKGPAGSMVKLRYGERIHEDGSLDQKELSRFIRSGDTQTDRYILKGDGQENWHPKFVYHGFQYVEVSFSHPDVELIELRGDVVHTDLARRGYFRSSNDMFNQLQENIGWSFTGNYHGYPTDCPHREKIGWTGDALLVAETGLFNFDLVPSYLKWIDDFDDEQRDDGQIPAIIPSSGWGYILGGNNDNRERGHGPQWEGALMEIPWQIYQHTGDTAVLSRYYPTFKNYIDYLTTHSNGHLLDFGIDDHKQLEPLTQGDYLSSAFYYYLTDMFSKIAAISGKKEDAAHYAQLAMKIKSAFNQNYYHKESGTYDHGGQTPQALALFFGLTEAEEEEKVLQKLLEAIERKNGHIDAGVVGTKAVINSLLKFGQERVLFEMADKRDFPGWGYWVDELGANTMFQNWDGSQSRNHIMFGTIGDYFFKGLAGINVDETRPGFRHFVLSPSFDNDVTWVEAGYDSAYGTISSHWKKDGDKVTLYVSIPPNCTADIILPASSHSFLELNGQKLEPESLEKILTSQGKRVRHSLGSGNYTYSLNKK